MGSHSVLVAMSGGVDSSVAAALLLQHGMRVVGATMQLHSTADREISAARAVCRALGVEHHVIDLSDRFRREVVEHFVAEYESGRTPNPCVRCNRLIKWHALVENARGWDINSVATGHYARVVSSDDGSPQLHTGVDPAKDQSYALWAVPLDRLARTTLPLGELTKSDTRRLAAELGLPTAKAEESQDVCFVPHDDYVRFLEDWSEETDSGSEVLKPGPIRASNGEQLGTHEGVARYTIGQRKGLGIALGRPQFVTRIDAPSRTIWVGDNEELMSENLEARSVNWLVKSPPRRGTTLSARIRYLHPGAEAEIVEATDESFLLRFAEPQRAVTPGQSAVLYNGTRVIGGGVIV